MAIIQDIAAKIGPHHRLLTIAFYVGAGLLLTIFPSFDKKTEIEEHGLIPGYADHQFRGRWSTRLGEVTQSLKTASSIASGISDALVAAEMPVYSANFTTLGVNGSFTYTLVQSARGDSREAVVIVIATNWTARKEAVASASWGLGIGVTLAQYLKQVNWLSKDVFIVFADRSLAYGVGTRAWLRAYFGGSSDIRRGVLRQAMVLDTTSKPTALMIEPEGINGMLPNQDVVNSYMLEAIRAGLPISHRFVWDAVVHHVGNGGVHGLHSPFLEAQIPTFTVRGMRGKTRGNVDISQDAVVHSLEGYIRALSNNLQQLHHSFNFYFFTGQKSHLSSGIYLYPVFGMQLPLISFLMTSPAYRDIRSFLVGLGLNVAISVVAGSPIFLLATSSTFAPLVQQAGLTTPLVCERSAIQDGDLQRNTVAVWLGCGGVAALALMLGLRRYAFALYQENESIKDEPATGAVKNTGVRLPYPLWESMHATSGLAFLMVLAPVTIASWAVAVPLTLIIVPLLVLVRPCSIRSRPLRSLIVFVFVLSNFFLLLVPPKLRDDICGGLVSATIKSANAFLSGTIVPMVPREGRRYVPTLLFDWLERGNLPKVFSADLLLSLFHLARDFNCVGGMLFPIFCFCYWPFLMLLILIGGVLPAQRVYNEGLGLREIRIFAMFTLVLLTGAFVGAIFWRSTSASGLGELQW